MTKSIRKKVRKLRQKPGSPFYQSPGHWPRKKREDAKMKDEGTKDY